MEAPTINQVKAYCASRGIRQFSGDEFFHFYSAIGWRVEQGGAEIVYWKHMIHAWESRGEFKNSRSTGDRRERMDETTKGEMKRAELVHCGQWDLEKDCPL